MSGERVKLREQDIQRQILDYLALRGIWHQRMNTGATISTHNGKQRMWRYGVPGTADILAFREFKSGFPPCCEVIGIEVKRPGNEQSAAQREWQREFEKAGGIYVLARSVDDVIKVLG